MTKKKMCNGHSYMYNRETAAISARLGGDLRREKTADNKRSQQMLKSTQ